MIADSWRVAQNSKWKVKVINTALLVIWASCNLASYSPASYIICSMQSLFCKDVASCEALRGVFSHVNAWQMWRMLQSRDDSSIAVRDCALLACYSSRKPRCITWLWLCRSMPHSLVNCCHATPSLYMPRKRGSTWHISFDPARMWVNWLYTRSVLTGQCFLWAVFFFEGTMLLAGPVTVLKTYGYIVSIFVLRHGKHIQHLTTS